MQSFLYDSLGSNVSKVGVWLRKCFLPVNPHHMKGAGDTHSITEFVTDTVRHAGLGRKVTVAGTINNDCRCHGKRTIPVKAADRLNVLVLHRWLNR